MGMGIRFRTGKSITLPEYPENIALHSLIACELSKKTFVGLFAVSQWAR